MLPRWIRTCRIQPPKSRRAPELRSSSALYISTNARFVSLANRSAAAIRRRSGLPGNGLTVWIGNVFAYDPFVGIGTAWLWLAGHVVRPQLTYMLQRALRVTSS